MDSKEWLTGPSWLSEPAEPSPLSSNRSEPCEAQLPDVETVLTAESEVVPGAGSVIVFYLERWSSLSKAVRVMVWVRRIIQNARNPEGTVRGGMPGTRQAAANRRQLALDP